MRTRFLNINYFSPDSNETLEDLNFLRLPLPYISPSKLCDEVEFLCFDPIPSISLDIERFPVENALSRFFSDVLPHRIFIGNGDFPVIGIDNEKEQRSYCSGTTEIQHAQKKAEILSEDKEVEIQRTLELEIQKESTSEQKNERDFKVIQFETPELNFFLEYPVCVFEDNDKKLLSEVLDTEIPLGMHNNNLGDTIPYPYAISESLYSVQDIILEYHMEQRSSYFVEDAGSVQDKPSLCSVKFPLLEVNKIGLEYNSSLSIEEELHLLLTSIGYQQWSQEDNLMVDGKELLGSMDVDILECLSEHCPSQLCLDAEPAFVNLVLEMDFISIKETTDLKGKSVIYPEASDGVVFSVMSPIHFQEVELLDLDSFQSFDDIVSTLTAKEPEICDQMFRDDTDYIGTFNNLIVSHELALVDESFKSLPVPVLCDEKEIFSLSAIVEEFLTDIKPHAPSLSDGIYLNWHFLEEDSCNRDICSTYWNMLEEINTYSTGIELKSVNDEMVVMDFVFCDDTADGSNMLEKKETLNDLLTDVGPSLVLKDEGQNPGIGKAIPQINTEKAPNFFKFMSQSNDLDFFLNPQKATANGHRKLAVKETTNTEAELPVVSSSNPIAVCASTDFKLQKWDIEVRQVKLSDNILRLVDNFQKSYLAILENDIDLKMNHCSLSDGDSLKFLSLPKEKLMDLIKNRIAQHSTVDRKDEILLAFVTLYAIKQMACYLCFYGIHTTYLFVDNLSRSLNSRVRLSFLHSLIEDAYRKADTEITESHPSLSAIQGILRSNISQSGSKVLIVADEVFWWPLKSLLTSMGISFDIQNIHTYPNQQDAWNSNEFTNFLLNALLQSDCLIITHEQFSASFPFNKFSIILEYGGAYESSRISTISPKLVGLPRVHFLKVELEDFSVPKALCDGVDVPKNTRFIMEEMSKLMSSLHEDINGQKFEEPPTFVPFEEEGIHMESSEHGDEESGSIPISVSSMPFGLRSKQVLSRMPAFPDIIIIVNTKNFDKEMLISRRSSYQKILAMEKGGAQVVEREINLPVDLIFSAAVCLVWYDCRNFEVEAATTEASSVVPLCIETIATNILMSLSFAFSNCIVVFEGESRLLDAIMESSDGLYAAAVSLGLDLQLFCSHSSELTDDIILSCINHATKLNRGLYPKMLESETLAESFLTKFPSINPLSAHSILSSGSILVEFLEWTHERRIQAIGKYRVPNESVALFSVLCRYGEHEESKSGMTDCSSVSSAPDSANIGAKIGDNQKNKKCIMTPSAIETPMDDYGIFDPLNQSTDDNLKHSGGSQLHQSWNFSKRHDIVDTITGHDFSLNNFFFDQTQGLDTSMMNNSGWNGIDRSQKLYNDFRGEAIKLSDSPLLVGDFSIENTVNFSTRKPEKVKDLTLGNSESARRLLLGKSNHPAFLSSAEINSNLDIWSSLNDHNQSLEEEILGHTVAKKDKLPLKTREFLEEKTLERSRGNGQRLSRSYGGTPLSNAIHSPGLHRGSPWTIEFLNKIKEKSRLHQKSFQCNTASTCNGYSSYIEKIAKRKSPSTLDCYRYQGSEDPKKIIKQKRQKQFFQSLSSLKHEKASASLIPTRTPIDKRARQTLSFARSGNETQSKLVWSDGNIQSLRKRSRNEM